MTFTELNLLSDALFVDAVGWVFEHSPWVAERVVGKRPFRHLDDMHLSMRLAVQNATAVEQLALIRAHPDLGARAKMSEASVGEQAGVGLDQLTAGEYETLHQLTQQLGVAIQIGNARAMLLALACTSHGQWHCSETDRRCQHGLYLG